MHAEVPGGGGRGQFGAQAPVGTDAAGDDEAARAGCLERAAALDDEGLDARLLEAARDVGAHGVAAVAALPGQQDLGLEPGKTEVQTGAIGHRPGEAEAPRRAGLGQFRQRRPARIRQAHQLGGLVEGLAGGVVEGVAEQAVAADRGDLDQHECPPDTSRATYGGCGASASSIGASRWPCMWCATSAGISRARASERAAAAPTSRAPTRPGPAV